MLIFQAFLTCLMAYFIAASAHAGYFFSNRLDFSGLSINSSQSLRILLYFMLSDLLMRFFFQRYPQKGAATYKALLIPHKKVIFYQEFKALSHWYNIFSFVIILSLLSGASVNDLNSGSAIILFLNILLLSLTDHVIMRLLYSQPGIIFRITLLTGVLLLLYFMADSVLKMDINYPPFFPLLLVSILLLLLPWNMQRQRKMLYLKEEASFRFQSFFTAAEGKSGAIDLTGLEWRLILRNKRSREQLIFNIMILPIFLLISNEIQGFLQITAFIFIFIPFYGYIQLAFSWENAYYSLIFSSHIDLEKYVRAKYRLLLGSGIIAGLITLLFYWYSGFLSPDNILLLLSVWLLVQGTIIPLYLLVNSRMITRISLASSAFFNSEGMGMPRMLAGLALIFSPSIFYLVLNQIFNEVQTLILLALPGIFGLFKIDTIIQYIAGSLDKLRYQILEPIQKAGEE